MGFMEGPFYTHWYFTIVMFRGFQRGTKPGHHWFRQTPAFRKTFFFGCFFIDVIGKVHGDNSVNFTSFHRTWKKVTSAVRETTVASRHNGGQLRVAPKPLDTIKLFREVSSILFPWCRVAIVSRTALRVTAVVFPVCTIISHSRNIHGDKYFL